MKLYWHLVCFKTVISSILLRSQKYIEMLSISNSKVFLLFQGFFSEKERLNFLLDLAFFILLVRYVIHIAESLFAIQILHFIRNTICIFTTWMNKNKYVFCLKNV